MRIPALAVVAGLALLLPGSASATVLYVGDSLGVGTSPYLRDELGRSRIDVDAKIGRPSGVGVDLLRGEIGPQYDVVVFDLGTNDDPAVPAALAADLREARQLAGDRCLVVATLNRPPLNGVSVDGLNRAVESFAASDPATALVDWHAQVQRNPGLLLDGIHPGPEGYRLRAQLFAQAIRSCASVGVTPTGGSRLGHAGFGSEGRHTQPLPEAEPEAEPAPPRQGRDPVDLVAQALARAIEVGAEFG
jgi:hypothetical protein